MPEQRFYEFLLAAFQNMNEAMRPGAAIYVFHADTEGLRFRAAFEDAGFQVRQVLIWEKNRFVFGRQDYQWRHEPILYGWKDGAAHYFIKDWSQDNIFMQEPEDLKSMKKQELLAIVEQFLETNKNLTTIQYEPNPQKSDLHPTMKPVPLVGRLLTNSSRPGWLIADFFAGSGTAVIAAEQLGRTACVMELDERNCDVIVKRWEELTGQKAVLLNE